jgi:hypothetical protein
LGTPWVKDADVHDVPFLLAGLIGAESVADLVAHVEAGDPWGYLEREQWKLVRGLVCETKVTFQHGFYHGGSFTVMWVMPCILSVWVVLSSLANLLTNHFFYDILLTDS